jgi:hypothetical protein
MGNPKYNEPSSFEEMAEQAEKADDPKTETNTVQAPGNPVEQTEATE